MEISEHKNLGITLFNSVWDLIDKKERSDDEKFDMIHKAHASCYHWQNGGGTAVNEARGEWQVSRVYALLEMGESALMHGKRSLGICLANDIKDFDLAFGYEAVARSYKVLNDAAQAAEYKKLALAACQNIAKEGDRSYAEGEINSII